MSRGAAFPEEALRPLLRRYSQRRGRIRLVTAVDPGLDRSRQVRGKIGEVPVDGGDAAPDGHGGGDAGPLPGVALSPPATAEPERSGDVACDGGALLARP